MLINTRRLITEQTIEENLMTSLGGSPPLDIFIRTSGVKRLSGFLQWQVCLCSFPVFTSPYHQSLFILLVCLPSPISKKWTFFLSTLAIMAYTHPNRRFHQTHSYFSQCCENTQIHMVDTYWPDFGLWDFVPILLDYQRKVWARSSS
jgi:hypothetical protein